MNDERFRKNELLRETARMRESIEKDGALRRCRAVRLF
jgi:hypothetical protein